MLLVRDVLKIWFGISKSNLFWYDIDKYHIYQNYHELRMSNNTAISQPAASAQLAVRPAASGSQQQYHAVLLLLACCKCMHMHHSLGTSQYHMQQAHAQLHLVLEPAPSNLACTAASQPAEPSEQAVCSVFIRFLLKNQI